MMEPLTAGLGVLEAYQKHMTYCLSLSAVLTVVIIGRILFVKPGLDKPQPTRSQERER